MLLALDWAKAFDSISPEALIDALRRFGIPEKFIAAVSGIYRNRTFEVKQISTPHGQYYGICQGCPLSLFLFSLLMTVLMHDAKSSYTAHPRY
jgi:hypothetical protein